MHFFLKRKYTKRNIKRSEIVEKRAAIKVELSKPKKKELISDHLCMRSVDKVHKSGNQQSHNQRRQQHRRNILETRRTNNMANANDDTAQPSLAIDPMRYIEKLPEYGGKLDDLHSFINIVEDVIPFILTYNVASQKILFNRIKAKLVSKARETIEINNHVSSWNEIKEVLINNFGDRKSASQIYDELRSVQFNTNSVDFYNVIKHTLRRLNNKCKEEPNSKTICAANTESALNIFKHKIPEPMRSILFSRNPTTLESAMDILYEGNYAYYNPCRRNYNDVRTHNRQHPFNNNNNLNRNYRYDNNNNRNYRNYTNSNNNNYYRNYNQSANSRIRQPNNNSHHSNNPPHPNNQNRSEPVPMEVDSSIQNFHLTASETYPI